MLPAIVKPIKAAIPNNRIKVISPSFPIFLVDIDTIPPASIRIATIIPAKPLNSPVFKIMFAKPTAKD